MKMINKLLPKAPFKSETEMREEQVPKMESLWQLVKYINKQVNREHDYGTCVYAISLSSYATFRYVANKLGITGFQASCADLDIIRRTRHIKSPLRLIDFGDILFPQNHYRFENVISEDLAKWIKEEAIKKLETTPDAHPNVLAHWKSLAKGNLPFGFKVEGK